MDKFDSFKAQRNIGEILSVLRHTPSDITDIADLLDMTYHMAQWYVQHLLRQGSIRLHSEVVGGTVMRPANGRPRKLYAA